MDLSQPGPDGSDRLPRRHVLERRHPGHLVLALVLRFGQRAEVAAWAFSYLMLLLCGLYYPVSVLPAGVKQFAQFIPLTYFLDYFRHFYGFPLLSAHPLLYGFSQTVIYLGPVLPVLAPDSQVGPAAGHYPQAVGMIGAIGDLTRLLAFLEPSLPGCRGMIGVFDSGFGGLVVLREFLQVLPDYDYLYLGDNARIPYGTRSDRVVIRFTEQAVDYLFRQGCHLIVLACHTASARALRTHPADLAAGTLPGPPGPGGADPHGGRGPGPDPPRKRIGVIATEGTVTSQSFELELNKLDPEVQVFQQACPLLVPIIEEGEQEWEGTALILKRYLAPFREAAVDTLILGCTHYSILKDQVGALMGDGTRLICSGQVTAGKLVDYLKRHPEMEARLSRGRSRRYLTTDLTPRFQHLASLFMGRNLRSEVVEL